MSKVRQARGVGKAARRRERQERVVDIRKTATDRNGQSGMGRHGKVSKDVRMGTTADEQGSTRLGKGRGGVATRHAWKKSWNRGEYTTQRKTRGKKGTRGLHHSPKPSP